MKIIKYVFIFLASLAVTSVVFYFTRSDFELYIHALHTTSFLYYMFVMDFIWNFVYLFFIVYSFTNYKKRKEKRELILVIFSFLAFTFQIIIPKLMVIFSTPQFFGAYDTLSFSEMYLFLNATITLFILFTLVVTLLIAKPTSSSEESLFIDDESLFSSLTSHEEFEEFISFINEQISFIQTHSSLSINEKHLFQKYIEKINQTITLYDSLLTDAKKHLAKEEIQNMMLSFEHFSKETIESHEQLILKEIQKNKQLLEK